MSEFRIIFLSAIIFILPVFIFSQNIQSEDSAGNGYTDTTIPEILLRPARTESPRYPRDRIIGTLGQGTAPDGAWNYANVILSALISGTLGSVKAVDADLLGKSLAALTDVEPGKYHIGGGRTEEDGTVSFLVRFLGRDQWMTGELYILFRNDAWYLDDLVLEEAQDLNEGKDAYPYDFTPYERFF